MPFMIPEYTDEPFILITYDTGDAYAVPREYVDDQDESVISLENMDSGYFARLTAPGYLDCTDWAGPFATLEDAREYIMETYDVDPDTGEELSS